MTHAAYIFDCDGTLTDSMPWHFVALCKVLVPLGMTVDEDHFYSLAGRPTEAVIRQLAAEQQVELDAVALTRAKEDEFLRNLELLEPVPAVCEIVRRERGRLPLAVASGGLRPIIERQLAHIGLADQFDVVVTAEDTPRHKPHPDVFLEAARRLGVPPEQCLVYEDADLGIEAARRAGMRWVDIRAFHRPRRMTA